FSFREDIQTGIRKFYDKEELAKALVLKNLDLSGTDESLKATAEEEVTLTQLEFIVASTREDNKEVLKELRSGVEKRGYAIRLLSLILSRAAEREASDIHFEPRLDSTVIRVRVDGILQEMRRM